MDISVPNICNVYDTFSYMPYLNKKSRYWFGRKKCPCPAQLTKEEINQVIITLRPISLWSQNRLTRR